MPAKYVGAIRYSHGVSMRLRLLKVVVFRCGRKEGNTGQVCRDKVMNREDNKIGRRWEASGKRREVSKVLGVSRFDSVAELDAPSLYLYISIAISIYPTFIMSSVQS